MTYYQSVKLDTNHAYLQGFACFHFYHYTLCIIYMQDLAAVNFLKQACAHGPGNKRCISLWHFSYLLLTQNNTESAISYNVWAIVSTLCSRLHTMVLLCAEMPHGNSRGRWKHLSGRVQIGMRYIASILNLPVPRYVSYGMSVCLGRELDSDITRMLLSLTRGLHRDKWVYMLTSPLLSVITTLTACVYTYIPCSDSSLVLPEDYWKSCGVHAPESCVSS